MSAHQPHSVVDTEPELVLQARGVRVSGRQGVAVDGLDVDLVAGGLCVLHGPDGSGKTSALLALAGRMRTDDGEIEVAGHALPRHRGAVQRSVSLAEVPGVNDLDDALTVSAHIAERLATHTLLPWARTRDVEAMMERYTSALRAAQQDGRMRTVRTEVGPQWWVGDLTGVERALFGIVLALAGGPSVVAVDETGDLRSREDRQAVAVGVGHLMRSATTPVAVLATSTEPVDGALLAAVTGLPESSITLVDLGAPSGGADPVAESGARTAPAGEESIASQERVASDEPAMSGNEPSMFGESAESDQRSTSGARTASGAPSTPGVPPAPEEVAPTDDSARVHQAIASDELTPHQEGNRPDETTPAALRHHGSVRPEPRTERDIDENVVDGDHADTGAGAPHAPTSGPPGSAPLHTHAGHDPQAAHDPHAAPDVPKATK